MSRRRPLDLSKISFYIVCSTTVIGLSFLFGLYSGAGRTAVFRAVESTRLTIWEAFSTMRADASTIAGIHPTHFLQPARSQAAGITVNEAADDDGLVLLSGFFDDSNELRLIRRDGSLVNRWRVRFSELFPDVRHIRDREPPSTDWNIDTHGAVALPDGSMVFNFEYAGLVKLDRCGHPLWTVRQQTHHSVERAEGGGFWVPSRRYHPAGSESSLVPFATPLLEDTIIKVSDDGVVSHEISVPGALYASGLGGIVTTHYFDRVHAGNPPTEMMHVNKVEELTSDIAAQFPQFAAGDLLLSDRTHNLLFVIDPATEKVKWWRVGSWQRQHDPEFSPRGTILLFNNNTFRMDTDEISPYDATTRTLSQVVELNPTTDEYRIVFGGSESQPLLSMIRGKVEPTERGVLVTEFEGGRAFEADARGRIIWEYVNRYDDDEVAEVTEARLYASDYFAVTTWSCQ
jgi:hypothetical protein